MVWLFTATRGTEMSVFFNTNSGIEKFSENLHHENSDQKVKTRRSYFIIDKQMLLASARTNRVPKYLIVK